MNEIPKHYMQETTGIRYPIGDLFGYPDSLIKARTAVAYDFALANLSGSYDFVMDFGSGRGHGVKRINDTLHPLTIVSVDKYAPYLEAQKAVLAPDNTSASYEFLQHSGPPLPFPDESFDAIFFMHVLEHIKDPIPLLEEMYRKLRRSGVIVVATPNRKNLVGNNPYDEHVYTEEELPFMMYSIGFTPEQFHVIPNNRALRVHNRKKWLATHAPLTGKIRNKVTPGAWDRAVLRLGISSRPLESSDFNVSTQSDEHAIDLLIIARK